MKAIEILMIMETVRPVESLKPVGDMKHAKVPIQKRSYSKQKLSKKEKITTNHRLAIRITPLGNKEVVATQSANHALITGVEKEKEYEPLPEDEEDGYDPIEDDMVDDDYGKNFIINAGIVFGLPVQFDRVSENKDEYVLNDAANGKTLCCL